MNTPSPVLRTVALRLQTLSNDPRLYSNAKLSTDLGLLRAAVESGVSDFETMERRVAFLESRPLLRIGWDRWKVFLAGLLKLVADWLGK